jgi:L-serine dehydratase
MPAPAAIDTSLFDLFESGPGPSSSHTIAPMKAGRDFLCWCSARIGTADAAGPLRFRVRLFGSLSATGAGHGTAAAVLAGLLGHEPARCPSGLLKKLAADRQSAHAVAVGRHEAVAGPEDVIPDRISHDFPYSNTLVFSLLDAEGRNLLEREYYSVGGGFLQWKGWRGEQRGLPVHPYRNMHQLAEILRVSGLTLHELMLENESAITGMERASILEKLETLLEAMLESVRRGLETEGSLPGSLDVQRKARTLYHKSTTMPLRGDRFLGHLNAYAMATAEENADGGVIVTAPTCGAAGVMPSLLYAMRHDLAVGDRAMREGLLAAAAVAFLAKRNAAIAGAEVGCQGEVGVASAMAAATLAHARGASARITENSAEIALEHHLGLTCDPVGGYVQIPCIERNAMGAIKAYNAYLLASMENPGHHRVSLDSVIAALAETGRDMNAKFKETSLGGLAVSMVNC